MTTFNSLKKKFVNNAQFYNTLYLWLVMLKSPRSQASSMGKQYPVITVTGPRQSGKTTLVRLFPARLCFLEDLDQRHLLLKILEDVSSV